MFDIGFLEILIVVTLTLIVVGPERLPGAIRFIGRWVGKVRETFNGVRVEIEREVQAEEFKQRFKQTVGEIEGATNEVGGVNQTLENSISESIRHASVSEANFPDSEAAKKSQD